MLKLRLQRRGKKNYATYRVVVAQASAPIQGKFIDDLGFYNPHSNTFTVEGEAVQKWLKQGAKPSTTVHNLLVTHGLIQGEKVTSWRPKQKPQEAQSTPPASTGKPQGESKPEEATKG
ncbi:MAG: 30S ribosomal protein S16 [Patescibacteria group bacterium]